LVVFELVVFGTTKLSLKSRQFLQEVYQDALKKERDAYVYIHACASLDVLYISGHGCYKVLFVL
jgi:hypothetical protein